jgi:hypothetical protein
MILGLLDESAKSSVLITAISHGTDNRTVATASGHGTVAAMISTGVTLGAALITRRGRHPSAAH